MVTARHPNRILLDVSGTVADIEKMLHIRLKQYPHPEEARTFYAPDTEPVLDLAVPVLHISGLDNYRLPRPAIIRPVAPRRGPAPNLGSGPNGSYMGDDFRAAYAPGRFAHRLRPSGWPSGIRRLLCQRHHLLRNSGASAQCASEDGAAG